MGKRTVALMAALAAFAFLTMGASSCGTTSTKTQPDTSNGAASTPHPSSPRSAARVGDSITLAGQNGLRVKVTLEDVQRHVRVDQFDAPDPGKKLIGVDLLMRNVSGVQYDDSPSNGAELVLGDDSQADATITTSGSCDSPSDVKLAPGEARRICIPFTAPDGVGAKTFQMTLDSGFGPQAGEWRLH